MTQRAIEQFLFVGFAKKPSISVLSFAWHFDVSPNQLNIETSRNVESCLPLRTRSGNDELMCFSLTHQMATDLSGIYIALFRLIKRWIWFLKSDDKSDKRKEGKTKRKLEGCYQRCPDRSCDEAWSLIYSAVYVTVLKMSNKGYL